MSQTPFSKWLLDWFDACGRHDLPWQRNPSPYTVWVSEIMLQQTRVSAVIPYYQRFIERFPDLKTLAKADGDTMLRYWAGLGYYARGRNLHRAAQIVHAQYGGSLPDDKAQLLKLPGIGPSTAGAILALAFHQRHAILDGNVKRVLSRFHAVRGWPGRPRVERRLWRLSEAHTPARRVADYTQAIMDLGATVCVRSRPRCDVCPVAADCAARRRGTQRQYPAPKPGKALPTKRMICLILQNRARELLLQKRPPTGVWGGLWCLPVCAADEDVEAWVLSSTGYSVTVVEALPSIEHGLTHFRMNIVPLRLRVLGCHGVKSADQQQWCSPAHAVEYPLPAPVKKLLLSLPQ